MAALPAASQSSEEAEVTFTRFTVSPEVLSRQGGILTVDVLAETNATEITVTLDLVDPGGQVVDRDEQHILVSRATNEVGGQIEIPVRQDSRPGEWTIRVSEVLVGTDGQARSVSADGVRSAPFEVYGLLPVAGLQSDPWPQPGGDSSHTGRTVAVGPPARSLVERWTFQPPDDRPLHSPVVGSGDTIYAVSWGGSVYALNQSGALVWDSPRQVDGEVVYPPALGPRDNLLVPAGDEVLTAVTPTGEIAWTHQAEDDGFRSGPAIGPQGRIFYLRAPWTLVALDASGDRIFETPLPEPDGGVPSQPGLPEPVPGPRIAVDEDGTAFATAGEGLAAVAPNGTIVANVTCSCSPQAVGLAPRVDVAVIVGDQEVVGASTRTGEEIWSTDDQSVTTLEDDVWHPPAIGWDNNVYIASEDGRIHTITINGVHQRTIDFRDPFRGQPILDANGHVYFADACRTLRSVTEDLKPRWTHEIDATGCPGLAQSLALTVGGTIAWPAPDGSLRALGANRPPQPAFDVYWNGDEFVFDATPSIDPDGGDLSFAWTFGAEAQDRGRVVRPGLPALGSVNVTLTVSDGLATASTTREVELNFPPTPQISNRTTEDGIVLNASLSQDPEGDPITYNWTVDGRPQGSGATLGLPASQPRVYNVTLTVSDGNLEADRTEIVLAPDHTDWSHSLLAVVRGDCPSGACTVPSKLTFTEDRLAAVTIANGAGRTLYVETSLPTVPGGPERLTLEPRDRQALYVRANASHSAAFTLRPVGGSATTDVPLDVRPAAAPLKWSIVEDPELEAGTEGTLTLRLQGDAPPYPVSASFSLQSDDGVLATNSVNLDAGEAVNRTVALTFTPSTAGPLDVMITGQSADRTRATVNPAPGTSETQTFEVSEPGLLTSFFQLFSNSVYVTAGTAILAGLSIAGVAFVLVQRRREGPATTQPPAPADSGGSAGVANQDGATVAEGFMPRKVDRFHVERVLGEGGFGTTYLAEDSVLERDVVLKDLENVGHGEARDLLLHEAKTAANLQHGNVVVVHDVIEEEGRLLLVMEYIEGGTLADRIDAGLSLKEALPLAQDILQGLAALHEAGIVHRDLKPSNILIAPEGTAKITDFGVAASLDEPLGDDEAFVGTPRFMAPEQLAKQGSGPTADVYAAGALVYHMLTGDHHLGLEDKTPPADVLLERDVRLPIPDVPDALNEVLARALAEDPEERFPDAGAFLDALTSLDVGDTTTPDTSTHKE